MSLGVNSTGSSLSSFGLFNLNKSSKATASSLAKLSSGRKINTGADNPAGLVISNYLRSQLGGLQQAQRNTQEANNVLATAEGGLSQMSDMLVKARELAVASLNTGVTGSSQTSANQSELNGLLNSITHAAQSTNFAGKSLLNGSQGITFSADDPSGLVNVQASSLNEVADVAGLKANVNYSGQAADQAERAHLETSLAGNGANLGSDVKFTVTGTTGSHEFAFTGDQTVADAASAINQLSDSTGVTAYTYTDANGNDQLRLASNDYGSDQFVQVTQADGTAAFGAPQSARDAGQDARVSVAGQAVTASGLSVQVDNANFSGRIELNAGTAAATTVAQTGYDQANLTDATTARSATIGDVSGGMRFQLGEGSGTQNRTVFGIGSMDPTNLGQVTRGGQSYSLNDLFSGGKASLANDPAAALAAIDQAIADVSNQRAQIGAYQANTLETNANSLEVAFTNITSTESGIADTDMASEITALIKNQLLEKTGLKSIQSMNLQAANVLKLLG